MKMYFDVRLNTSVRMELTCFSLWDSGGFCS